MMDVHQSAKKNSSTHCSMHFKYSQENEANSILVAALEVLAAHDEDSRQKRLSVRCPDDMIAQLFKKGRP
jgi:hypothetical protein